MARTRIDSASPLPQACTATDTGQELVSAQVLHDFHTAVEKEMLSGMINQVRRWFRPRLQSGLKREEWTCECGEVLWEDIAEDDAESAAYIQSLRDQERGGGSEAANSHHRIPGERTFQAGQDENDNGTSVAPHLTDTASNTSSPNPWGRSFFALCADKSLSRIEFVEVETTTLRTDGELFARLRDGYNAISGWRRHFRWVMHPVDVHWVEWSVEDQNQEAGVYYGPFTVPPVEMVSAGIYQYEPVPLGTVPVSGKHFIQNLLYGHADPKSPIHRTDRLLKRMPKKLRTSLNEDARQRPNETAVGPTNVEAGPCKLETLATRAETKASVRKDYGNNPAGKSSILIAHGAFSSSREYDRVVPFSSKDYHVLIPDLPSHGEAMHIHPFTLAYTSQLLAKLIERKAHNGTAHLVGFSLGAHVVVDLAWRRPDITGVVFVSGHNLYALTIFTPLVPPLAYVVQYASDLVPRSVVRWAMNADLRRVKKGVLTLTLSRQIAATVVSDKWPELSPARMLIVAAKKGLTDGLIQDAVRLRDIERQKNPTSMAVQHTGMKHPWNCQDPELFAEAVKSWIEGRDLPKGFEEL
ncbi:hypothetical protein B0A49_02537 [Cryomyces minteri]|uniref:AB hydrolase-1 domain-containing protein n=1 Tax=Cryomyces minteri TaxID=331657 RepID=A0A4U0XW08_9PEZI|nr:hypothetical protein B0A49_02537 [Cryomyces minteri]